MLRDAAIDQVIVPTTRLFMEGAVRLAGYTTESPEELEKDYKYAADIARRFEDDDEVYSSATGNVPSVVIPSASESNPSSVSNDILAAVAAKKKLGQNSQSSWEIIERETNQSIASSETENVNQCLAEETNMSVDVSPFSTQVPRVA